MSNIAVIGFGYWGKNLIRNFFDLGVLHSICDTEISRKNLIDDQFANVTFSQNYAEILKNPEIKAVAICTPAYTHYKMVKQALENGKDVFVEKPLALTVGEGEELVRLAAQHHQILMVGHILRYHPAIVQLSHLINEGALGKIQYIYSNRLNMGKIRTEENILWSFAPHDISVIIALLNEQPCSVLCRGNAYLSSEIADVTNTYFLFPSGVSAHIFVSWLHPFKEQRLVIIGSEKMAVFDDTAESKLVVYPHRVEWKKRIPTAVKADKEIIPIETFEPLRAELEHFLECIKTRKRPITDGAEGLEVLRVLDACERSMADSEDRPDPGKKTTSEKTYFVHETACIDEPCKIGVGTKIWHFSHIMKGAKIGKHCSFGQNCCISPDVVVGNNVKVQNNVSVYTGTTIEDDVFLGPSCVLTNVTNPRSQVNRHSIYEKTVLRRGATIGANATIVCGVEIGRYAFVGAGTTVTKNVPDYALVIGSPARQTGWMSRHGHRLVNSDSEGKMKCPESGYLYQEKEPGVLRCLDLDEDAPLPKKLAVGKYSYDNFKLTD